MFLFLFTLALLAFGEETLNSPPGEFSPGRENRVAEITSTDFCEACRMVPDFAFHYVVNQIKSGNMNLNIDAGSLRMLLCHDPLYMGKFKKSLQVLNDFYILVDISTVVRAAVMGCFKTTLKSSTRFLAPLKLMP
jgi:hypothetical protein